MFEVAEAYERQRGRSSKLLAPLFIDFVGVKGEVIDVGCGTGALTLAMAQKKSVSKIVGIDVSHAFIAYARSKTNDPRIVFEKGDAQNLALSDASFDQCVALLVIPFMSDPLKAVKEMNRVTRSGGTVATATWDTTGGNELNDVLTETALILDPKADPKPPGVENTSGTYGSQQDLSSLWEAAGLTNIETTSLLFPCNFESFNDFWQPLTEGQGPAGAYLRAISADRRNALRNLLRERILGSGVDGPLTLRAKAWAVRGVVP